MKRTISLIAAICMMSLMIPNSYAGTEQNVIYVSEYGDDENTGDVNNMLKTFQGAQNRVRELQKSKSSDEDIYVIFKEGTYRFDKTSNMTEADSPIGDYRIIYMGEEGEKVKFSGSEELDISSFYIPPEDDYILSRIPDPARGSILCMDLSDYNIADIPDNASSFYDHIIFINGKAQTNAMWPNGDGVYSKFDVIEEGCSSDGGIFRYYDDEPGNWECIKDAYFGGYFTYDYVYYMYKPQEIDKTYKEIKLKLGEVSSPLSRRWKAFNLPEVLDIPGEWYLDRDTNILYFYPPYDLKKTDTVEISTLSDAMISIEGTDNITFKNIEFEKSRGYAVTVCNGSEQCTVTDCTFSDITGGIKHLSNGTTASVKKADMSSNVSGFMFDIADNWIVENSIFCNIYSDAVNIYGGNYDTLESGNSVIRNNYATRYQLVRKGYNAFGVNGVSNSVVNNVIHNSPGGSIAFSGSYHNISYNEINNVLRETKDTGAIYSGNNIILRGTEVAYNIIKNILPTDPLIDEYHNRGVYYDDALCGQINHHNFYINGDKAVTFSGNGGKIYSNIIVNMISGIQLYKNTNVVGTDNMSKRYELWENALEAGVDSEVYALYNNVFPEILEEAEKRGTEDIFVQETVMNDNFFVKSGNSVDERIADGENGVVIKNNIYLESFDDFVAPEEGDYRIKSTSDILLENNTLLSEDFDINLIGIEDNKIDTDKVIQKRPFNLLYPEDSSKCEDYSDIEFNWEVSVGADKYVIEIAKNAEFTDTVFSFECDYNTYNADLSEYEGETLYWRVRAINETREFKGEWYNDNGVYSFSSGKEYEKTVITDWANKYESINAAVFSSNALSVIDTMERITQKKIDAAIICNKSDLNYYNMQLADDYNDADIAVIGAKISNDRVHQGAAEEIISLENLIRRMNKRNNDIRIIVTDYSQNADIKALCEYYNAIYIDINNSEDISAVLKCADFGALNITDKGYVMPLYDKFEPRRITVTQEWAKENLTGMENFDFAETEEGLKITNNGDSEKSITYSFNSNIFHMKAEAEEGVKYFIGSAQTDCSIPRIYERMIIQKKDMNCKFIVPAGKSVVIDEIFTDEINSIEEYQVVKVDEKNILMCDLSYYSNCGAMTENGDELVGYENIDLLSGNPRLAVKKDTALYKTNNGLYKPANSDKVYNVSAWANSDKELVNVYESAVTRYGLESSGKFTFELKEGYYENVSFVAFGPQYPYDRSGNDISLKVYIEYSDGETAEQIIYPDKTELGKNTIYCESFTVIKADNSTSKKKLYEYTIDTDNRRKVLNVSVEVPSDYSERKSFFIAGLSAQINDTPFVLDVKTSGDESVWTKPGETYEVTVKVNNGKFNKLTAVTAFYDGDILCEAYTDIIESSIPSEVNIITRMVKIPDSKKGKMKILLLDSLENIKPLAKLYEEDAHEH